MLTTEEAALQKLPGWDVWHNVHIHYINEINRDWLSAFIYREAYHIISEVISVKFGKELAIEQEEYEKWSNACDITISLPDMPISRLRAKHENFENLKVGSGLEMTLKANLAGMDYVVHEIDANVKGFSEPAKAQRSRPIKFSEILGISGFLFNGSFNFHPAIKESTIKFHTILTKDPYKEILNLTLSEFEDIDFYRKLRNKIHFPSSGAMTMEKRNLLMRESLFLKNFANVHLVEKQKQIIAKHSFRFDEIDYFKY